MFSFQSKTLLMLDRHLQLKSKLKLEMNMLGTGYCFFKGTTFILI